MSLLSTAEQERQSTFMREAGMADTGDYLWQHAEKLKEKVLEKHGKRACERFELCISFLH